ncbi:S41 family peptidase [Spongiimicrobium sp. 2-473A-2-J]|uniref:S41 family peptidase n=1 Tax=Eudoraea algarum TaxID=3417568 RepID=UPI003D364357
MASFFKQLFSPPIWLLWSCLIGSNVSMGQATSTKLEVDNAYTLYTEGKLREALPLLLQLSDKSPYNDDFHYLVGDVQYRLGNFEAAIEAFQRNVALEGSTNGLSYTYLALSKAHVQQGNKKEALDYLLKAFTLNIELQGRIIKDPLFDFFRNDSRYVKTITGRTLPKQHTRNEAWEADLDYLKLLIEDTHIAPFAHVDRNNWETVIARTRKLIPLLEDYEIVCEFQRIAAMVNDGHTVVYNPRLPSHEKLAFHHLPLMLYYFGTELYVRSASEKYKDLVGKRVLKIGDRDIRDIEDDLWRYHHGNDNRMQFYWQTPWYLVLPEILKYYGATNSLRNVEFTLGDDQGAEETVVLQTDQLLTKRYQKSTAPQSWVNMRDNAGRDVPYYLQNPDSLFWHTQLRDNNLLYLQINKIRNKKDLTLERYMEQVMGQLEEKNARALIIDLRLNNGGNTRLMKPLIKSIIKNERINQRGSLFVITGRNTFSAAMNLSSALEKWTNAIFVGEPTGSSPNFVGEEKNIRLPYSRLNISISNTAWIGGLNSLDTRKWIAPELGAPLTIWDYQHNIDPCLRAIFDYLADQDRD